MLVVDFLHEFELGVWKAIFIHLIRILYAEDSDLVNELDRRYVFFVILEHTNEAGMVQVSISTNSWPRNNPTVCHQLVRDEEAGWT